MKAKFFLTLAALTFNALLSAQASSSACSVPEKEFDTALQSMFSYALKNPQPAPSAPAPKLAILGCSGDQVKAALKISYQNSIDEKYRARVRAYFRQQPQTETISTANIEVKAASGAH
jgi:hypothetical protein